MAATWTAEQIIALAPDASSVKSGKELANVRKWVTLGQHEDVVWGECQGSGKNPYQTQIDTSEPAFKCSCPSRKFPCKHGLGLFLLLTSQPAALTGSEPPAWVDEWLESRAKRAEKAQQRAAEGKEKAADPAAQAKRAQSRQARVAAGLQELELWLRDLVRGGLAAVPSRPYNYWEAMAARLVDAQAPGLARWVRDMAGVSASGADWQEDLLRRLGLLHLAIEGFRCIDDLPPATQADLRSLAGWTYPQEELATQPSVHDQWLLLGQRMEEEDRLRVQRTWLWGRASGRPALILNFAHGNAPLDTTLVPGSAIQADLAFYPGTWRLRAVVAQRSGPPQALEGTLPGESVAEAVAQFASVLAVYPWLDAMPVALRDVVVVPGETQWQVRDAAGHELPLSPHFENQWRLLAFSGGKPLALFGEWDSRWVRPFGAVAEGRWIGL